MRFSITTIAIFASILTAAQAIPAQVTRDLDHHHHSKEHPRGTLPSRGFEHGHHHGHEHPRGFEHGHHHGHEHPRGLEHGHHHGHEHPRGLEHDRHHGHEHG